MDRNFFLAFALSFAVLTLWMYWQAEQQPPIPLGGEPIVEGERPREGEEPAPSIAPLPERAAALERAGAAPARDLAAPAWGNGTPRTFEYEDALVAAVLTSRGAGLTHWELKGYRALPAEGGGPVVLTTGEPPYATMLITPFLEFGFGDLSTAPFQVVEETAESVVYEFMHDGVTVRKAYRFEPESYAFSLRVTVENGTDRSIAPEFSIHWPAHKRDGQDFQDQAFVAFEEGDIEQQPVAGIGLPGFWGRLSGERPRRVLEYPGEISWAGVQERYFLAVLLPDRPADARARFVAIEPGTAGTTELVFAPVRLPPGQSFAREFRAYVGPKEAERLVAMGAQLDRTLYIGWAWVKPFAGFFGALLRICYEIIPNYGVAIILLTVLVRVVTAPLTIKQMRSMEGMRKLQPKIKELQARHGDDRQKQSEAMMKLYKQEGVNPLGGCLPMILQLPVFIGLYYALQGSIELRHQPFFGWIDDLSAPETLFTLPGLGLPVRVLPIVMGASMILQQRLTPTTMDPAQAKMMMTVMPIMFTGLFYQFPSGLVLYWMVSNFLAIAHQLWIGRKMRAAA